MKVVWFNAVLGFWAEMCCVKKRGWEPRVFTKGQFTERFAKNGDQCINKG